MEDHFLTDRFKKEIHDNALGKMFPALGRDDRNFLAEQLFKIVDTIANKFNFDMTKRDVYEKQFQQNDYRDLRGLVLLLLPFIDESYSSIQEIRSLDDIYITKRMDGVQDIKKGQPKYIYSNIQYNRCVREKYGNKILPKSEIRFNRDHVIHNMHLILESIQEMSNKLYVNWINVRPMSNLNYTESRLYKSTVKHTNDSTYAYWDPIKNNEDGRNYRGLYVGDMYNTISKYLYDDIKDIKWLIYDMVIEKDVSPYIIILGDLLELSYILNGKTWEDLSNDEREIFKAKWEQLIQRSKNNQSYESYSNPTITTILKSIIVFFERGYGDLSRAISDGYVPIGKKTDEEEDDEEEIEERTIIKSTLAELLPSIQSVGSDHIYNYLKFTIDLFLATWYGIRISKYDYKLQRYTILSREELERQEDEFDVGASLKLIYNFSKSFSHQTINKRFTPMPRLWKSLSSEQKNEILSRLNTKSDATIKSWFNISKTLRNIYGVQEGQTDAMIIKYFKSIHGNIHKIVFDVLTTNGILSEFIPDPTLSDNRRLPEDSRERNNRIADLLGKTVMKGHDGRIRDEWQESYYFLINKKFKDMDKISFKMDNKRFKKSYLEQIAEDMSSFLGSWSTTYAMDWISQIGFFHRYMNNRVMYVTGATGVGKSTQVPKLLLYALKMVDYNTTGKIVCTQPRIPPTVGNAKTISQQMGVPIEEYDDASGEQVLTDNFNIQYKYKKHQHMKRVDSLTLKIVTDGSLYEELKSNPILKRAYVTDGKMTYRQRNMYDVVIVDEAHEHNSNMDMILTMMKYAAYYNNNIKLIIVSATMDQDEPIYRYYYRDVNDNRMAPFNTFLIDNSLDRINVDRRLHISPPGETTRFKITDIYNPDGNSDQTVLDILKKDPAGDILLFKTGVRGINESIEFINANTPANVIAIPLYGKMKDSKREFVLHIDRNKHDLTIPKTINYDKDFDEDKIDKVPRGTYDRVVIVATNIAEASITVGSLRYVVETGYQKTNDYDYRIRDSRLKEFDISESSRLQRRGRVGRTADGIVYYMYKKGTKEDIKMAYGISIQDMNNTMYDLLRNRYNESPLFPERLNPNGPSFSLDKTYPRKDITSILSRQYFLNGVFQDYQGFNDHYDYDNRGVPDAYYETGYSKSTMLDDSGKFYIIHPEELNLVRDIIGNIVAASTSEITFKDGSIKSPKMDSFFEILRERLMIYDVDRDVNKTEYGVKISAIKREFDMEDIRDVIVYLYSRKYNSMKYVVSALVLRDSLDSSIKNLFSTFMFKGKPQPSIERGKGMYGNNYGDCVGLAKISSKIISFFDKNVYNIKKLITKEDFTDVLSSKMDENNDKIKKWADQNVLSGNLVIDFLNRYITFINKLYKIEKGIIEETYDRPRVDVDFRWFDDRLVAVPEYSNYEMHQITMPFIHAYGFNSALNIMKTFKFLPMSNVEPYNIRSIAKIGPFKETLLTDGSLGEYILFLGYDRDKDRNLFALNRVTPQMIQSAVPFIYSPEYLTSIKSDKNSEAIRHIEEQGKDVKHESVQIIGFYLKTIEKIKIDLMNSYDPRVYKNLLKLDGSPEFARFIDGRVKTYNKIRLKN